MRCKGTAFFKPASVWVKIFKYFFTVGICMGLFRIERLFRYICKRIIIITANIMKDNYCVIMGGGIGSRFWPFSRESYPKQFLDFLGADGLYCK